MTGTVPSATSAGSATNFTGSLVGDVTGTQGATTIAATSAAGTDIVSAINTGGTTGAIGIANGGTGQTTATLALNALLPSQGGNANKFLKTDGAGTITWGSGAGGTTFDAIGGGTNNSANAMIVGNTSSLTYSGSGTINASSLEGSTWENPPAMGTTTPAAATFTTVTAKTANATISGSGTSGDPATGYAGRVVLQNGASPTFTLSRTIYNSNVTASSVILMTCERDANSNSSGVEYVVNLAYNSGRAIVANTSFGVELKRADGSQIPASNGCTINYMIIN